MFNNSYKPVVYIYCNSNYILCTFLTNDGFKPLPIGVISIITIDDISSKSSCISIIDNGCKLLHIMKLYITREYTTVI